MSETESAIMSVAPIRGRRPVVLKDGMSLSEARQTARSTVVDAKTVKRNARTAHVDAMKKHKLAFNRSALADKHLAKVREQRFATPADKRNAVAAAAQAAKTAKAELKVAAKAEADTYKALDKADTAVTKAEGERLKVEEKYQASKVN